MRHADATAWILWPQAGMVNDPFDYDPVPFQSAGKIKVRYKMSECDNTANVGQSFEGKADPPPYRYHCCGWSFGSGHSPNCPTVKRPETPVVHHVYGLDEPTRKMIEQLLAGNLERLAGRVIGLLRKINERVQGMPTAAEFSQLIGDVKTIIDTDRTALATKDADIAAKAARIAELEAQIAAGGMTAAEEQAVFDELLALKNPPTP